MTDPLAPKGPGRGHHPNSRKSLVPGGKAGVRVVLTKDFVKRQVEWLSDNEDYFREMMAQLPPKDFVAAYLKMVDLIVPKKQDITMTEGIPEQTFQINFGKPTPEQQLALHEAETVPDISSTPYDESIRLDSFTDLHYGAQNDAQDD